MKPFSLILLSICSVGAEDCINIIIGHSNDTTGGHLGPDSVENKVWLRINEIDTIDYGYMVQIRTVWGLSLQAGIASYTPYYYSFFETFIAKISCAVVWPLNAEILKDTTFTKVIRTY